MVAWMMLSRALTHRSALVRLPTAAAVGFALLTVAWAFAYIALPEGATRLSVGAAPRLDAVASPSVVAITLFVWNMGFGFGVIGFASLFSIGPISLAYLAPWTWLVRFGLALGTNSFVLFVPGARMAPLDPRVLLSHAGVPELIAYVVLATVLANASLWRQRRITDRHLIRIRRLADIRLTRLELAFVVLAFAMLASASIIETSQIAALQRL